MYKHSDDGVGRTQQLSEAQAARITRLRRGQVDHQKLSPRKKAQRAVESNYSKEKADVSNLSPGKKVQRALEMEMEKTATENGYHITGMIRRFKASIAYSHLKESS